MGALLIPSPYYCVSLKVEKLDIYLKEKANTKHKFMSPIL